MIDEKTEVVLTEIFGMYSGWSGGEERPGKMCPGFPDITSFAQMIANDPSEEVLQQFLSEHPQMLFGLFGEGGDSDQAFLTKPPIGNSYNADFAILNVSQGGCKITLVELEPVQKQLFTQKLTPAHRLQGAIGQVQDWSQWINLNKQTFVRDTVDIAKKALKHPDKSTNNSFKIWESEHIENSWRSFGGFDDTIVKYAIIIGRWSKMSEEERKRLVFLNRQESKIVTIFTYDQIVRRAYDRPVTRSY